MQEFAARIQTVHHSTQDRKSSTKVHAKKESAVKTPSAMLK